MSKRQTEKLDNPENTNEQLNQTAEVLRNINFQLTPNFLLFELFAGRISLAETIRLIQFPDISSGKYKTILSTAEKKQQELTELSTNSLLERTRKEQLLFVTERIKAGDYRCDGTFEERLHPLILFKTLNGVIAYLNFGEVKGLINNEEAKRIWEAISKSWPKFVRACERIDPNSRDSRMTAYFVPLFDEKKEEALNNVRKFAQAHEIDISMFEKSLAEYKIVPMTTNSADRKQHIIDHLQTWNVTPEKVDEIINQLYAQSLKLPPKTDELKTFGTQRAYDLATRWLEVHLGLTHSVAGPDVKTTEPGSVFDRSYAVTILVGNEPKVQYTTGINDTNLNLLGLSVHEVTHLTQWYKIKELLEKGQITQEEAGFWSFYHPPHKELQAVINEDYAPQIAMETGEKANLYYRNKMRAIRARVDFMINLEECPIEHAREYLKKQKVGTKFLPESDQKKILEHCINIPMDYVMTYVVGPHIYKQWIGKATKNLFWPKLEFLKQTGSLVVPSVSQLKEMAETDFHKIQYYDKATAIDELHTHVELDEDIKPLLTKLWTIMVGLFPVQDTMVKILNKDTLTPPGVASESVPANANPQLLWHGLNSESQTTQRIHTAKELLQDALKLKNKKDLNLHTQQAIDKIIHYCQFVTEFGGIDLTMSFNLALNDPMHMLYSLRTSLFIFWNYFTVDQQKEVIRQIPGHLNTMSRVLRQASPQRWAEFVDLLPKLEVQILAKAQALGIDPGEVKIPKSILERKGRINFSKLKSKVIETSPMAIHLSGYSPKEIIDRAEAYLKADFDISKVLLLPPFELSKLPNYVDLLVKILSKHGVNIPNSVSSISGTEGITGSSYETNFILGKHFATAPENVEFPTAVKALIDHELAVMGDEGLREFMSGEKAGKAFVFFAKQQIIDGLKNKESHQILFTKILREIGLSEDLIAIFSKSLASLDDDTALSTLNFLQKMSPVIFKIRKLRMKTALKNKARGSIDELKEFYVNQRRITLLREHTDTQEGSSLFDNLGLSMVGHELGHLVLVLLHYRKEINSLHPALNLLTRPESEGWLDHLGQQLLLELLEDTELCLELGIDIEREKEKLMAIRRVRAMQAILDVGINVEGWTSEEAIKHVRSYLNCNFTTAVSTFLPIIQRIRNNPTVISTGYFMGYEKWEEVLKITDKYGHNRIDALLRLHAWEPQFILDHPEIIENL